MKDYESTCIRDSIREMTEQLAKYDVRVLDWAKFVCNIHGIDMANCYIFCSIAMAELNGTELPRKCSEWELKWGKEVARLCKNG